MERPDLIAARRKELRRSYIQCTVDRVRHYGECRFTEYDRPRDADDPTPGAAEMFATIAVLLNSLPGTNGPPEPRTLRGELQTECARRGWLLQRDYLSPSKEWVIWAPLLRCEDCHGRGRLWRPQRIEMDWSSPIDPSAIACVTEEFDCPRCTGKGLRQVGADIGPEVDVE